MSRKWLRLETMSRSKLRDAVNAELRTKQPDKAEKPVQAASSETTPPTVVDSRSESVDSTQAADSPSAVRTLCQAANDLKSNADDLDRKEVDSAIDTLQDVLQFLRKTRRSGKPSTGAIPLGINVPLGSTPSPATS